MKINQLRFKNLNSLVGEWSVDFTAPEYIADGIFAISGPTGAGKSTIMDAICLALYGRTPRLKNISKTTNEIMSRQTGVCFAEVVFETHDGIFRAYWSQRRARERSEGALQNPEHEISSAVTKEVIASQLTTTRIEIENRTGMDYDRFVQSMMLAQGGFAAFLQATGNERAPILEQLTGSEIYSRLSIHVFDRQRTEKADLENLKAESSGIKLLTREEEEQTVAELNERNANKTSLQSKVGQLDAAIKWLKTISDIKNELEAISRNEAGLAREILDFKPKRQILQNALRASLLDSDFASLTGLRTQQNEDLSALKLLQIQTPDLDISRSGAQSSLDAAEKHFTEARTGRESLLEITKQVRLLDQEIGQKSSGIETLEAQISRLKSEEENEIAKKAGIRKSIDNLNTGLEIINNYMAVNQADIALVAEFTGIKATVAVIMDAQKTVSSANEYLEASKKSLESKKDEIEEVTKDLAVAAVTNTSDHKRSVDLLAEITGLLNGKLPEQLQAQKDKLILHLADLRKIAGMDTERARLEDGKPCPLCGSLNHPFAEGNIPAATEAEKEYAVLIGLTEKLGALNQELNNSKTNEKNSSDKIIQITNKQNLLLQQKLQTEENILRNTTDLETSGTNYARVSAGLKTVLKPYGIAEIPLTEKEFFSLINSLEDRKDKWLNNEKRKVRLEAEIREKESEIKISETIIEARLKDIASKDKEAAENKSSLSILTARRKDLFGEKIVDDEEETLSIKVRKAEKERDKARELFLQRNRLVEENKTRITDLLVKTKTKQSSLEKNEKQFKKLLAETGFSDEASFVSDRLPAGEREKLQKDANDLDAKQAELNTKKKVNEQSLAKERLKKLTDEKPDILMVRYEESAAALSQLLLETGALNQKLITNNEAKARGEEIGRKIENKSKIYERWAKLSSLIGSADGKKYRNFAQGLTLEIMVSYANSQLVKLSDRYLLIRDKEEPLELNVIDNYQAGEIRSTKNLSGGESFIVSLALALGLSRMSSRNVRVDSLFLDEGFGSLDEDTLETALTTLAGLHQDGKMIGVISHVGAMKERINTKIIVQPIREGRSVLSGPGCMAIN